MSTTAAATPAADATGSDRGSPVTTTAHTCAPGQVSVHPAHRGDPSRATITGTLHGLRRPAGGAGPTAAAAMAASAPTAPAA